jgi:hypothetical protein
VERGESALIYPILLRRTGPFFLPLRRRTCSALDSY